MSITSFSVGSRREPQRSIVRTALCGSLLLAATWLSPAVAQQPGAPATRVALVDIGKLLEGNGEFKDAMEAIGKEAKDFEDTIRARQQELAAKAEGLKDLVPSSPDYSAREAGLARETAALQVDVGLKKKELLEREAKIYFQAYSRIQGILQEICVRRQINLVIRYENEPIDPANRASVMRGVNREIVYSLPQMDITAEALAQLPPPKNPSPSVGPPGAQAGVPGAPAGYRPGGAAPGAGAPRTGSLPRPPVR